MAASADRPSGRALGRLTAAGLAVSAAGGMALPRAPATPEPPIEIVRVALVDVAVGRVVHGRTALIEGRHTQISAVVVNGRL